MNILVLVLDNITAEITGGGQTVLNLSKVWLDNGNDVSILMPRKWHDYLLLKKALNKACILEVKESPEKCNTINVIFTYVIRLLQGIRYIVKLISIMNLNFIFVSGTLTSLVTAYIAETLHFLKYGKKPIILMPFYHFTPLEASYKKEHIKYVQYIIAVSSLRFARKFVTYFFTESTYTARWLNKNLQIAKSSILPIGGGIDYDFIKKIEEKIAYPRKLFDACFIGRIHPSKGVFDLVNAWYTVRNKIPEAKLALIGGGYPSYREKLEEAIKRLNLINNVILFDYVSEEDKFKILKQSKFLAHPSYEECIPLTFFEAASLGVPIVTYYLSTYENIRNHIISLKKGNIKQLADTLTTYITEYNTDPKIFSPLIESGIELAKRHSWRNIAKTIISKTNSSAKTLC